MEEIIGSCILYLLYKILISIHISLPVAGLIWSWMSQRMAVPEARSSPVHSAQSWPAPQHYNCQWWPGSGSGVLRLLPSKSSQSQAAAQISWDTIFGGVTPLGGDGGHGRSREWQAGARQGIIIKIIYFDDFVFLRWIFAWGWFISGLSQLLFQNWQVQIPNQSPSPLIAG